MFKIGYRSIYNLNFRAAIFEAKRNGFSLVEVHLTSPQFLPNRYSKKQRQEIKKFAAKHGITIQIHASLEQSLIYIDLNLREGERKHLETMVRFGQEIGARCITLHPGKAAIYHDSDGKKLKDDEIHSKFYKNLFKESIKHIISIAPDDIFICIENTDNFTPEYRQVLSKYLPSGKVFLTWDIRKNYSYITNELIKEQWKFLLKNKDYVKNLHISGFNAAHGELKGWEDKIERFLKLFRDKDLPMIVEIMPLADAVRAKKVIKTISESF
jgi:sugar phosphate isomerase/epimerase